MKFEHTRVWGFEHALRGMRNPKNSWDKSDSDLTGLCKFEDISADMHCEQCHFFDGFGRDCLPRIGRNDMECAQRLIRGGAEHRKFMRQIFVSVDITAPLYWWKEFDTYKVGTVANSTSTMHKIQSDPITLHCFETDDYKPDLEIICENESDDGRELFCVSEFADLAVQFMEILRNKYNETGNRDYWKELIRWLPCGWLQKRTITMNYENLLAMCSRGQRRSHKLSEWSQSFISWARTLPYAQELIFMDELLPDKKVCTIDLDQYGISEDELLQLLSKNAESRASEDTNGGDAA